MSKPHTTAARDLEHFHRLLASTAELRHGCTLLDIRSKDVVDDQHLPGSAQLSVAGEHCERGELASHLLGPPGSGLLVCAENPDKARQVAESLVLRGWNADYLDADFPVGALRPGPATGALWRPDPYLVRCLERWIPDAPDSQEPPRSIDLGAGSGRDAVFLAQRGYDCLIVDRYEDALALARERARRHGVSLRTLCTNLRAEGALAAAECELALSIRFLHRPLLKAMHEHVRAQGFLMLRSFGLDPKRSAPQNMRGHHRLAAEELPELLPERHWRFVDGPGVSWEDGECWIQFLAQRK